VGCVYLGFLAKLHLMTTDNQVHSLRFSSKKPKLEVLDQLLLPHSKVYIDVPDVEAAWKVIRSMQIRGMEFEFCVCSNI
jgi:hypothetical protein